MATYYKKKDDVKLKPGQALGYTAGKGYYAAGTPTPPKPPPAAVKPSSKAAPTTTRPKAADTPTAPPSHASPPYISPRAIEDDYLTTDDARRSDARAGRSAPSSTPKLSVSTAHYEHPGDVPLKPGQSLALEAERGYYAAGRPNPEKASSTPASSTTKVTALSARASTESPLKEHVETRDGKTSITLSHATKPGEKTSQEKKVAAHAHERTAKPHTSADRDHATVRNTKKASSRVHDQVGKSKNRSHHPESKIKHHPGRPKRGPLATAASKHGTKHGTVRLRPGGKLAVQGVQQLATPSYLISSDIAANVNGVVDIDFGADGNLEFTSGDTVLYSLPVDGLQGLEASATLNPHGFAGSLTAKLPSVPGVKSEVTVDSDGAVTLAIAGNGVESTITFKPEGEIEIETTVHRDIQGQSVKLALTTTLTPRASKTSGQRSTAQSETAPKPAKKTVTKPIRVTRPFRVPGTTSGAGDAAEAGSDAEAGSEAIGAEGAEGVDVLLDLIGLALL